MKTYALLFTIWIFCLLVGCTDSANKKLVSDAPLISATYSDDTGREIHLPKAPTKVISIAPNITEMVFAIDAQDKLIARSQACDYPPEAEEIESVTTFPGIDREELKATGADLILTTDEIFSDKDIELLGSLGMPIYLQSYQNLEDVYQSIRNLGEILDVKNRAIEVADSLKDLETRVVKATLKEIPYGTMILITTNPLKVVGGSGFLNELIEKAGGKNVFKDLPNPYPVVTVEAILAAQPEYLILPSKNAQVYAELIEKYPALINTPADVQKHVFIIDPDLVYRPGPRMLEGLLEMTHILHTQLNPQIFLEAN